MTKPALTTKKPRKQHTPEFRQEALKLAKRIGVAAAARELSLYKSQLHNWRSKRHCCKVSDEAAFCLIQRPYISKTLLTRRISPRGSP